MQSPKALHACAPIETPYAKEPLSIGMGAQQENPEARHTLLEAQATPLNAEELKYNALHQGNGLATPLKNDRPQLAPVKATPKPEVETLNKLLLNR